MARIRSVHPGFWTDEAFVSVSPLARLLAIGIWNECDDQGAFAWKPVTLKMRLLPADNVDVTALLAELEAADVVRRYSVEGRELGAVRNFAKFQRPKKPHYTHPMPDPLRAYAGHDAASAEPDDDETPSGAPPPKANGAGIAHQFPTSSPPVPQKAEIAPQMEETLRSQEEKEREEPPVRPPADLPKPAAPRAASLRERTPAKPEPEFEEFMRRYPKPVGRLRASAAWGTARKHASAADILAGLARHQFNPVHRYIPAPAVWLNGGHWGDVQPLNAYAEPGKPSREGTLAQLARGVRVREQARMATPGELPYGPS